MSERVPRSQSELQHQFNVQLQMLTRRCDSYYEGHHYEAHDIASVLRKMLYDYRQSKSVLGLIGQKETIKYLDSRVHNNLALPSLKGAWPRTVMPYSLYSDKDMHSFDEWWTKQRFVIQFKDVNFSREELVLTIANQDGGDHVDPTIDRRIAGLRRTKSPWRTISDGEGNDQGIYGFELASICAIGEELIYSLTENKEEWYKRVGLEGMT